MAKETSSVCGCRWRTLWTQDVTFIIYDILYRNFKTQLFEILLSCSVNAGCFVEYNACYVLHFVTAIMLRHTKNIYEICNCKPHCLKANFLKVKQMIYIAVLCNPKITAEPLYNTPLVRWTLCRCQQYGAFSMKALARYQLYCLLNRGTLRVNNLPRVVAQIMPRSELNPRPLDHESNALPLHHSDVIFIQIDQHLKKLLQKYNGVPIFWITV